MGTFLSKIVKVLFAILTICIVFATIGIDKHTDNSFHNTVKLDNGIYYLGAALLLGLLLWGLFLRKKMLPADEIRRKQWLTPGVYYGVLLAMALVVAILQTIVVRWKPCTGDYYGQDFL